MSEQRPTALITGASAGIGMELAREFAREGFDLILVARTGDKLERLAITLEREHAVRCRTFAMDLSCTGAPLDLFTELDRAGVSVEVLVNNAGIGHYGLFSAKTLDEHLAVVGLNVVALTAMTRLFLPSALARGRGRILNVASVAAFQPTPMIALYGATKAFVLSLTEALSVELEGTGVTATALCPGFTGTEMIKNLSLEAENPGMVPDFALLDPAQVAREGVEACLAGRGVHVNGAGYRLGLLWEAWQPRWVIRSMSSALTGFLTDRRR